MDGGKSIHVLRQGGDGDRKPSPGHEATLQTERQTAKMDLATLQVELDNDEKALAQLGDNIEEVEKGLEMWEVLNCDSAREGIAAMRGMW